MNIPRNLLNIFVIGAVVIAIGVASAFGYWIFRGTTISVQGNGEAISKAQPTSPLTGLPCANATRRPIAIMVSSDAEARPLAGIGQADMVFELPVTPNGITRMMAVFQCSDPKEIGSIRSARGSFIPLVQGLHALYAHWGGEHEVLAQLNNHIVDNVDALLYEGTTYYRKSAIPRPHNGFSTLARIRLKASELGYGASSSLDTYMHTNDIPKQNLSELVTEVTVPWPQGMNVSFRYNANTNAYLRWRGGTPEVDANTGTQVSVGVVIVMHSDATFLYDQYIAVRTTGQGTSTIYQNGQRIEAQWHKQTATSMLTFTDARGTPIAFTRGTLWVAIDAPLP